MKKLTKILFMASLLVLTFATTSFAQYCEPKQVNLTNGAATVTGKTGGCNRFAFVIDQDQRVRVVLASTDNKARFELQDGAEDETGAKSYSNLTSFDRVLTFTDFSIDVEGTSSTAFTLKIIVTDR